MQLNKHGHTFIKAQYVASCFMLHDSHIFRVHIAYSNQTAQAIIPDIGLVFLAFCFLGLPD
jgi:hypothetical protein